MAKYKIKCAGCDKKFKLICKNCGRKKFDEVMDVNTKKLVCRKCNKSLTEVKHECRRFFGKNRKTSTSLKNNYDNFISK